MTREQESVVSAVFGDSQGYADIPPLPCMLEPPQCVSPSSYEGSLYRVTLLCSGVRILVGFCIVRILRLCLSCASVDGHLYHLHPAFVFRLTCASSLLFSPQVRVRQEQA